ncbi:class I adenylate cyclase [Escherichia coli]|uniref:class I adenylate cyclase n=1 Tax=Escherichia coli TaxID=562 RepID=UPI00388F7F9B
MEYNRYLNKLVAWAWFNGSLIDRTCLYIKGNGIVDLPKLQEMVADVSHHFRCACLHRRQKRSTACVKFAIWRLSLTWNMDPTAAFRNQVVHFDFRKLDVFSFGENQNCLVGSGSAVPQSRGTKCVRCTSTASSR